MPQRISTRKELNELRREMARRTNNRNFIDELLDEIETGNLAEIYKREHDALDATDEQLEKLGLSGTTQLKKQLEETRLRLQMRVDLIDAAAESALNSKQPSWFDSKLNVIGVTATAIVVSIALILNL